MAWKEGEQLSEKVKTQTVTPETGFLLELFTAEELEIAKKSKIIEETEEKKVYSEILKLIKDTPSQAKSIIRFTTFHTKTLFDALSIMQKFNGSTEIKSLTDFVSKNKEKLLKIYADAVTVKTSIPRIPTRPAEMDIVDSRLSKSCFLPDKTIHKALRENKEQTELEIRYAPFGTKACQRNVIVISSADENILSNYNLTYYDKVVHDAIVTLYNDETIQYSINTLYKIMVNDTTQKGGLHSTTKETLLNSIRKMMRMLVRIKTYDGNKIEGCVLPCKILNDDVVTLLDMPILCKEAKLHKHIKSYNSELLVTYKVDKEGKLTSKKETNTAERIAVRAYLIAQILYMQAPNCNSNHTRLYETILKETGVGIPSNRSAFKVWKDYIKTVLTNFKMQGFINGFSVIKKGQKEMGVSISTKIVTIN